MGDYGLMADDKFKELTATKKLMALPSQTITPRQLQQSKICPSSEKARQFLAKAAKAGLGVINKGANKCSFVFIKHSQ